jgi:hypothetical protein
MPPKPTTRIRQNRVGGVKPLARVLDRMVERKGWKRSFDKMRILGAWDEAVGHQLARTTKAVEFRKDRESRETTMLIRVQDNTAANFFSLNTPLYLAKLREVLGEAAPQRLQFTVGALEKQKNEKPFKPPRLSSAEKNRIAQSLGHVPENLRQAVQAAAEALSATRLERQKLGFVPCPICQTLTERPEPCPHCRVLLRDPNTQRQKILLVRNPDLLQNLEPDEQTACAKHLALEYLLEQLHTLAQQTLHSMGQPTLHSMGQPTLHQAPEMRYYLELTAKAYLALLLGRELASIAVKDWRNLPTQVRGVLEAGL